MTTSRRSFIRSASAMGVFLMLSADYVIGSRGDFKISANEVAIGLKIIFLLV